MEVGRIIYHARKRAGFSLRELAERSGTSHATISAYEQGHKMPLADTLVRILDAAGVALIPTPVLRADHSPAARIAKGEELVQALRLASAFPARHDKRIEYPQFGHVA